MGDFESISLCTSGPLCDDVTMSYIPNDKIVATRYKNYCSSKTQSYRITPRELYTQLICKISKTTTVNRDGMGGSV